MSRRELLELTLSFLEASNRCQHLRKRKIHLQTCCLSSRPGLDLVRHRFESGAANRALTKIGPHVFLHFSQGFAVYLRERLLRGTRGSDAIHKCGKFVSISIAKYQHVYQETALRVEQATPVPLVVFNRLAADIYQRREPHPIAASQRVCPVLRNLAEQDSAILLLHA